MVVAAQKAGFDCAFFTGQLGLARLAEFAFDSDRKLMSVIYQQATAPADSAYRLPAETALVLVKGAPECESSDCSQMSVGLGEKADSTVSQVS